MLMQPLNAQVRYQSGTEIVALQGDMDAFDETVLQAAYTEVLTHHPNRPILLNFSAVGSIHKRALALLVALAVQAGEARQRLMVCGLSEHDQHIFEISRLTDFMQLFPDEEQALARGPQTPSAGLHSTDAESTQT